MMNYKIEAQKWLNEYGQAWIQGDADALAQLFHKDATYQETPFDEPMKGRRRIRAYWKDGAGDAQEDVSFSSEVWSVSKNDAIAGWTASFRRIRTGVRVELDGVFKLSFVNGHAKMQCTDLQEWWHRRECN